MELNKYRAQIKSRVWQAIAQSGVDLGSISSENQNKLVDVLTDHMLLAVDEVFEGASPAKAAPDLDEEEVVLWEGRPFLSLVEFYTVTNERIKLVKGMIGKDIENFELIRVQDIDVSQNLSERVLGIGDITITGADASNPQVVLRNIKDPNAVYEVIRKAWLAARKRYGLIFREDM